MPTGRVRLSGTAGVMRKPFTVGMVFIASSVLASNAAAGLPEEWLLENTTWQIHVTMYRPIIPIGNLTRHAEQLRTLEVMEEYDLIIRVLKHRDSNERKIARFRSEPQNAPAYLRECKYVIEVDAATGCFEQLDMQKPLPSCPGGTFTEESGRDVFLFMKGARPPLDWILSADDFAQREGERSRRAEYPLSRGTLFKETALIAVRGESLIEIVAGREPAETYIAPCRVVQLWAPGEPWWRAMKRYEERRLMMVAIRLDEYGIPMVDLEELVTPDLERMREMSVEEYIHQMYEERREAIRDRARRSETGQLSAGDIAALEAIDAEERRRNEWKRQRAAEKTPEENR